jgi:hypothetical protein
LVFLIYLLAGGLGLLVEAPGWLILLSIVAGLGAWDLDHFLFRLNAVERVELGSGLGRDHLRRLAIIEAISLVVGLAALYLRPQISFWWVVLLVLLALFGIGRLVGFIRKEAEQ